MGEFADALDTLRHCEDDALEAAERRLVSVIRRTMIADLEWDLDHFMGMIDAPSSDLKVFRAWLAYHLETFATLGVDKPQATKDVTDRRAGTATMSSYTDTPPHTSP